MNRFLYLLILLFCTKLSFSQIKNDYIITKSGDTIHGEVKVELFGIVKYKTAGSDGYTKIKRKEIKEYFYSKNEYPYVSITFPNGFTNFLERIETGKITLYRQVITQYSTGGVTGAPLNTTNIQWFAEKGNSGLKLIKTNQIINISNSKKERKATLYEFISDNVALTDQFKAADTYGFDEIRKVIKSYNEQALM